MSRLPRSRAASLLLVSCLWAQCALAADWTQPARELASRIAAQSAGAATSVAYRNFSSMSAAEVAEARRALEQELRAAKLRPAEPDRATVRVQVTFSQSASAWVWVAEVRRGEKETVLMASAPRAPAASAPGLASVAIRKELLFAAAERILDAFVVGAGNERRLVALTPEHVSIYKPGSGAAGWEPAQARLEIARARPWPRDLRGRLMPRKTHLFDAFLPGVLCTSTAAAPYAMTCAESDEPWPLTVPEQPPQYAFYGAQRNFFNGALRPGFGELRTAPAFYSAAGLPRTNFTLWLFAGVDGALRVTDGLNERVLARHGWGSDVAAVTASCAGPLALASGGGDSTSPDTVTAMAVAGLEPQAASAPAEFPGPVTALWSAPDGASALAVSKNLKTGVYEAYRLTLACGQ